MLTNGQTPIVGTLEGALGATATPPQSGDTALTFCFCTAPPAREGVRPPRTEHRA